jgi:Bacterial tandem repeat domain 1
MDPLVAYHGVTSAEHQAYIGELRQKNYRMVSVSVCGNPATARYAAAWLREAGPAWETAHGLSGAEVHHFLDRWTMRGYHPTLLAASGSSIDAIFAVVVERGAPVSWKARCGITDAQWQTECSSALAAKQTLTSFSAYGSARDRRYAAIWINALETYPCRDSRTLAAIAPEHPLLPGCTTLLIPRADFLKPEEIVSRLR